MTIRGIMILVGEGTEGTKDVKAYNVEAEDIFVLFRKAGMEYGERVNTHLGSAHNFISYVDCDGHDKMLKLNRVAQTLIGYPGPIAGNVLIVSEAYGIEGMEAISLSEPGQRYVMSHLDGESLPDFVEAVAPVAIDTEGKREDRPRVALAFATDDTDKFFRFLENRKFGS